MNVPKQNQLCDSYQYKIDLHTHTAPVSPCSQIPPEQLVELYKFHGFDGVVITNHLFAELLKGPNAKASAAYYLNDFYKTKEAGEKVGLKVYLGLELRFPEYLNDYLLYGVAEQELETIIGLLNNSYVDFYQQYKSDKNVIVQAHPFRDDMKLVDPQFLDGIEVFNFHPGQNSRIAFAARYARANPELIITGGTDFHHPGHEAVCAMRCKTLPEDSFELAKILQSKDYLFDISGSLILP